MARSRTIRFRVTAADRDAMRSAAEESGLTVSEWIRQCCLQTTTTIDAPVFKRPRNSDS